MKNVLLALLLAAASAPAFATDATVTVDVASDVLYRGQSVTDDSAAVSAGIRLDNLAIEGVFATVSGTTIALEHLDQDGAVRADLAIGYGKSFEGLDLAVSAARVLNPVLRSADYTEIRVDGAYNVTDSLAITGNYAWTTTNAVGRDRYASLGLKVEDFLTPGLTVGGLASLQYYDNANRTEFNNAELYGSYALNDTVSFFGGYSWGGTSVLKVLDEVDVSFNASDLSNQGYVGIRATF